MIPVAPHWLELPLEPLPERQQFVAIALAAGILLLVLELVRRRKLREEYSWLWVVTSIVLIALALDGTLLERASGWIGAATSTSTLFFGAIVFLLLVALQFSVHLSKLAHRQKALAQRLALLEEEVERLRAVRDSAPPEAERIRPTLPLRELPQVGAAASDRKGDIA